MTIENIYPHTRADNIGGFNHALAYLFRTVIRHSVPALARMILIVFFEVVEARDTALGRRGITAVATAAATAKT